MTLPQTVAEKTQRGQEIAEILHLKFVRGFYQTDWGKKTALGIYETVAQLTGVQRV